jgi:hypothetical protein
MSSIIPLRAFRKQKNFPTSYSSGSLGSVTGPVIDITDVVRFIDTDSAYSLIKTDSKAFGQKQIATSSPARYYYWTNESDGDAYLYIYPPTTTAGDTAKLTILGYSPTDSFNLIRQIAHDKIILYAFWKAMLQKEEYDIADKFGKIADIWILDQKNILENRPIDIKLKKKVLAK